jgi:purine-binding chemotaxis protein CheW
MLSERRARMLVFRVGGERFALPLGVVNEVIDMPLVQPLPDASTRMLGIATLRGELVSIFDPRALLHAGAGESYDMTLLFTAGNRRIGLAIDDVYDPMLIDEDEIRPAPGVDAADVLVGVVRRGTDLIGVLDGEALMRAFATGDETSKE